MDELESRAHGGGARGIGDVHPGAGLSGATPMSLTLYFHPLSSFCHKVLIALYENETPFTPHIVDLMDAKANADFKAIWPIGKFPVLRDDAKGLTIPETSIIIEYLAQHYPGKTKLFPADADAARKMRGYDRIFDLYLNVPMQKAVTDRLRPAGQNDPYGVTQAKDLLETACGIVETEIAGKTWIMGGDFTMADCAAAPALFYANMLTPLAGTYKNTAAYLDRLMKRPSFARVLKEAQPYFAMIPK
jgi:glutathione S-transferase